MTQPLAIIGAGGTARDTGDLVRDINRAAEQWRLVGFYDDDVAKQGQVIDGVPVLGPVALAAESPAFVVIGVARSRNAGVRRVLSEKLGLPRDRYATLIHPTASVAASASIGAGSVLFQNVVVSAAVVIGDHVLVLQNTSIAHDAVIEDCATIAPGVLVSGSVRIGRSTYIGTGASIIEGATIGEGALVGIGSVVIRSVPPGQTVFGYPAQPIAPLRRH